MSYLLKCSEKSLESSKELVLKEVKDFKVVNKFLKLFEDWAQVNYAYKVKTETTKLF